MGKYEKYKIQFLERNKDLVKELSVNPPKLPYSLSPECLKRDELQLEQLKYRKLK